MSVDRYLSLITSEHNTRPKYVQTITATIQPLSDVMDAVLTFPRLYDLDVAVGVQLDAVGEWVGISRQLPIPLDVYFSFDDPDLGFDEGLWYGPFNPLTGLVNLPDDQYRTLIRAKIVANTWDGTIAGAYEAWDTLFSASGLEIVIIDNPQDNQYFSLDDARLGFDSGAVWYNGQRGGPLTMSLALLSPTPLDKVTQALFQIGMIDLKPSGVDIVQRYIQSVPGTPFFGFDMATNFVSGFDGGAWAITLN